MSALPKDFQWLNDEPSPKLLREALKYYGIKEIVGQKNSATILGWAKSIGGWISTFYKNDEIPWCGLFVGIVCKDAGLPYNQKMLSAQSWLNWGNKVDTPMLFDILVFKRPGGHHVGFYVGEDSNYYYVFGGNQDNQVSITKILKIRLVGARRTDWKIAQPANIRKVIIHSNTKISNNES
jgi:uncharacterized protein (TIGR02594 family)